MKKYILLLVMGSFISIYGHCNPIFGLKNEKPIFSELLEDEGVKSYQIPTFLVRWAIRYTDESTNLLPLFKNCRTINIAICDNTEFNYSKISKKINQSLVNSNYVNLIDIIDKESTISIKSLACNEFIRELVILIKDDENFIAISMTGKMNPREIAKAIVKLNRQKEVDS